MVKGSIKYNRWRHKQVAGRALVLWWQVAFNLTKKLDFLTSKSLKEYQTMFKHFINVSKVIKENHLNAVSLVVSHHW